MVEKLGLLSFRPSLPLPIYPLLPLHQFAVLARKEPAKSVKAVPGSRLVGHGAARNSHPRHYATASSRALWLTGNAYRRPLA